jgi:Xaa-Pro aminopeptidase
MNNTDVVMGHIGFGTSSLYPSMFNGASGLLGLCPAVPVLGSRERTLKKGDLVYVDIAFGMDGYHTDTTQIYSFGAAPSRETLEIQAHLLNLEQKAASLLYPGALPCDIYETILTLVDPRIQDRFMGLPGRTVPFIGHGVGLFVDEYPVLAKGFTQPLECGMTLALEPKVGLDGIGMVGSENTYLVTEDGGQCLTGGPRSIIVCG